MRRNQFTSHLSFLPAVLAYTDGAGWHPGIGDPTVMGWLTVLAYFTAAIACGVTAWRINQVQGWNSAELRFWGGLALALVFLGVNKQLDLQTWLTLTGKRWALAQGWYENRSVVQVLFIGFIFLAGLWLVRWAWRTLRAGPKANWVALAGFVFLGCFILIRAASFHHLDAFLKSGPGGLRMNWVLELGGLFLLIWSAMRRMGMNRTEPTLPLPQPQAGAGTDLPARAACKR